MPQPEPADAFLQKWAGVSGSERAHCQLLVGDLCRLLGVTEPELGRVRAVNEAQSAWQAA